MSAGTITNADSLILSMKSVILRSWQHAPLTSGGSLAWEARGGM